MSQCVLCEREFYSVEELFDKHTQVVCEKCRKQFDTKLKQTVINGVTVYYLFEYNDEMMSSLVALKGMGIKEMANALVLPNVREKLKRKFKFATFLYMPSSEDDDEERGFRHVEEIFHDIAKKTYYPLIKTNNHKQALCTYAERKKIIDYMQINHTYMYDGKKRVILVDDVITSGATIFGAAKLLGIEKFEILVLFLNHHNYT